MSLQHRKTKIKKVCHGAPRRRFLFFSLTGKHDFQIIRVWEEREFNGDRKYRIYWCCKYCGTLYKEYDAVEDVLLQEGIPIWDVPDEGKGPLIIKPPAPLERLAERFKKMEE